MRGISIAACVIALLNAGAISGASGKQPPLVATPDPVAAPARDISGILQPIRDGAKLPALAGVVIRGPRVVAQGAVGVRAVGSPDAATIDDRFHLGSCTKAMTATLIARLVDRGVMRWDMTIAEVFPERAERMHERFRSVRLDQLLTNRGGVPGDVPRDLWATLWKREGTPTEQRLTLLDGLLASKPTAEPGERNVYSNAGFSIAGAMAERVSGEAWEDLIRRELFEPLGITTAGFGAPGNPDNPGVIDQPRGHRTSGGALAGSTLTPVPPGPGGDNPPAIGPAGIVHMSLPDWAKFVGLHLAGDRALLDRRDEADPAFRLVCRASFAKLHQGIAGSGPLGDAGTHDSETDGYAMGWGIASRPWADGRVLTHSGSNTMWFCVTWIAPKKDLAVLAATNVAGSDAAKACDRAVWEMIQDALRQDSERPQEPR